MNPLFRAFCDELEKLATPRYEREIAAGNISRAQVAPKVPGTGIGFMQPTERKMTRQALAAPASVAPEQLARRRSINEGVFRAQRAAEGPQAASMLKGVGPGMMGGKIYTPDSSARFLRTVGAPLGGLRASAATLHPSLERGLVSSRPMDSTLNRAVLSHEQGERTSLKALNKNVGDGGRPHASHLGVTPILNEQQALRGDPEAVGAMSKVRQMHGDDKLVQSYIRRAGGTADAPLPSGGRGERAVARMMDRDVGKLNPASRIKGLQIKDLGGNIPYVPPMPGQGATLGSRLSAVGRRAKFIFRGR
jgi:hypothetical protein